MVDNMPQNQPKKSSSMRRGTLILFFAVAIAAVAYIAWSVNKNNDEALAENSNINQQVNVTKTIDNPSLTLQVPTGFAVCEQQSDFIEGIAAYIWSDGTCEHGGDAIDIQLFVYNDTSKDLETFLREKGEVFFTNFGENSNVQSQTVDGREIARVILGSDYLVAEKVNNKMVYIQSAIDDIGREKNKDATDIIARTIILNNDTANNSQLKFAFDSSNSGNGRLAFTSELYHFSIATPSEYGYLVNPDTGEELGSFTLTRTNKNTSEEPNRDTPNGFNTSADDRIGVTVFENNQDVTLDSLPGFISWQEMAQSSAGIEGSAITHAFSLANAIEAITASGIDAFSRSIYFVNDAYVVEISSADVPKGELYEIANTFHWLSN